jgi:hypothetical protein
MSAVLVVCGAVLAGVGIWRGYRGARSALVPALDDGDPTRSIIDAARPPHARMSVRRAARTAVGSLAWLALALYGLAMAQVGITLGGPR